MKIKKENNGLVLFKKNMLIGGLHQSGKTYLAKYISKIGNYKTLVFSPYEEEWINENVYYVKTNDYVKDFPKWCKNIINMAKKDEINLVIFDDADMLFRSHLDTSPELRTLVTGNSHFGSKGLGIIWITKRPQDIPTRIYNLCQIIAFFPMESPQVIKLLNNIYDGLGDTVKMLKWGTYEFILKKLGEKPIKVKVA